MDRPIGTVFFDFAGTLFSPRPPEDWVLAGAREMGLTLSREEIERLAAEYARAGLPGGADPADVPRELERFYAERDLSGECHRSAYVGLLETVTSAPAGLAERVYEQVLGPAGWLPYRDTEQVVAALLAGAVELRVVSNVGYDLRPILREYGLDALAANCTLSLEQGAIKPDAGIFEAALAASGSVAEETLMVGDDRIADAGAAAIGCRTLLLPVSPPGAVHGLDDVLRLVRG